MDDGKSTLIGRLLYEQRAVARDQIAVLHEESLRYGTSGDQVDVALLLDGLEAEREQGITIDVAYRHFGTATRRFLLADTPGHEQYTRNMVTGASTADVAVVLVDARKGLLRQTRRHALIVSLLGVRTVIVAVNKMDLVASSQTTFDTIGEAFALWARELGITTVRTIPISALHGDNVVSRSDSASWYAGPTILEALETVPLRHDVDLEAFRFPVQWVNRPHESFRGYCGTVAAGVARVGAEIVVQPSQQRTTIAEIFGANGSVGEVSAGDAATIMLADEIDVARGDLLSDATSPAEIANVFQATIIWMHQETLLPGRTYLVKLGTRTVAATFHRPKYKIDPETLEHLAADTLEVNDIGVGTFTTAEPLWFEPYRRNRTMGGFIVIDRYSNATLGAGMIHHAMHRSHNVRRQVLNVNKQARQRQSGHRSGIIWLTGLSGSGKTTIGNLLETSLHDLG
ncbi:MAG: GTP-binding protein, partial [Ilumatobacteraceae bacterium]